jgi:hypothetical protein
MNGGSFVGRYEWEALPVALAFSGLIIIELASTRRRASAALMGVILLLTLLESWAIATSRSDAFSFVANGWDPAAYLGWWGRLDPSPVLNYFGGEWVNARNLWGLATIGALATAVILALARLLGGKTKFSRLSTVAIAVALLCWGMALVSPFLLPAPLHYIASDLGPHPFPIPSQAIIVNGPRRQATVLSGPNLGVLPGRYRITVAYSLIDPKLGSTYFDVTETAANGKVTTTIAVPLPLSSVVTRKVIEINVTKSGSMSAILTWHGSGRLKVQSVTFAKIVTCRVVECQGNWL